MELIVSDFHAKIIQVLKFLGAKLVKKNLVQVCHLLSLILGCKILFVLDDAYIFIFHLLDTLEVYETNVSKFSKISWETQASEKFFA